MSEPQETPTEHVKDALAPRVRAFLCGLSENALPISYQALAKHLQLSPPNTILQLTTALEDLIAEDAAAGHPLIAALVISKARGGLPAPGFFDSAMRSGRVYDDPAAFHATEFDLAVKFWCGRR